MEEMELQARLSPYVERLASKDVLAMLLQELVIRSRDLAAIKQDLGSLDVLNVPVHDYLEMMMHHEQIMHGIMTTYDDGKQEILIDVEVEDANLKVNAISEKALRYRCVLSAAKRSVMVIFIVLNTPYVQGRIIPHPESDAIEIDLPYLNGHGFLYNRLIRRLCHYLTDI